MKFSPHPTLSPELGGEGKSEEEKGLKISPLAGAIYVRFQ
jgi:hypothetical protein